MKPAAPDGKLKSSDIVRADRIPGFGMSLSTTVRLTQSGWASCLVSTWSPAAGRVEASAEHRFSSSELDFIRDALRRLSAEPPVPITCDDIPILRLAFLDEFGGASFEVLEFHPSHTKAGIQPPVFREAWDLIHRPFQPHIKQQAEQADAGNRRSAGA
jgi:hypothetical protein